MSTYNLLDNVSSGFSLSLSVGYGTWVSEQSASIKNTVQRSFVGEQSILLTHTGAAGSTARIASGTGATRQIADPEETYRASMWFHHDINLREVYLGIEFFDSAGTSLGVTYSQGAMSDRSNSLAVTPEWTAMAHTAVAPINTYRAAVKVELRNLTSDPLDKYLWIDSIVLCPYGEVISPTTRKAMLWIPEYMSEADLEQTNPTEPLARFMDLIGVQLNEVNETIDDFNYVTVADGGDPADTSTLVDPSGYPLSGVKEEWLPWLSQLLGIKKFEVTGGYTPWYFLEQNYQTWSDWETLINTAPAAATVNLSNRSRSNGVASFTTATSHGFSIGDVVTVATSPATNFNGYYPVTGVSSNTFSYSQQYAVLSVTRSAPSTTATIVCSRPHGLSVSDQVQITGTGTTTIDGTRTVVSTLQVGDDGAHNAFTITSDAATNFTSYVGSVWPVNVGVTATSGTVVKASDLTWSFIESVNAYPIDPVVASVGLIGSGSIGIWGGTVEGIKRASRVALDGVDVAAQITGSGGVLTVTTSSPHQLNVGNFVEIYRSPLSKLNTTYVVASVTSPTSFTVAGASGSFATTGWITNKRVEVAKSAWSGQISSLVVSSGIMTITFSSQLPVSTLTGNVVISGTGNGSLDVTHSPASITVASNRMSISFSTAVSPISLIPAPSTSKAQVTCNRFCFIVSTLTSQTPNSDQVMNFAQLAKPAGGVLSHAYLP